MARDTVDLTPLEGKRALVEWFEAGIKPSSSFRIGTEHEKFGFFAGSYGPVPYEGKAGIRTILERLQGKLGWEFILENGLPIGLADPAGGGAISLEPGGQFELSGAPVETLHQTKAELEAHLADLAALCGPMGIRFLSLGMSPFWTREQTPVMPKSRYAIMRAYMPKVGSMGLDMMFRTSTVQVNLDFSSEADMVRKFRVGLALQPVATALFANSPFTEGRLNGLRSMRSEIWRDTDNARAGMLPFVFEDGFNFEHYVDYALDVPMYFVKRGDTYHDVSGQSFRDLMAGTLPGLPGERAVLSDWANHLSTIFPEVRLKRYLEMRGADAGSRAFLVALPAFWTGLLYDESCLDAAWDLVKGFSAETRQAWRDLVPREGMQASVDGRAMQDLAREVLAISRAGLKARAKADLMGADETQYLDCLDEVVTTGKTQADRLIEAFHGPWNGVVLPAFEAARI